jgi:RimJ/RimL family protein N-acetyltransferase
LGFRLWQEDDLPAFAAQNADARVMEFFPAPWSFEESRAAIERLRAHQIEHGFGIWLIELKDSRRFAGSMGLKRVPAEFPFAPAVEIGWRLGPGLWGKGLATEGARACLDYGFRTLGLEEIVSFTAALNRRSERVMQRLGMTFCGHFDHPAVAIGQQLRPHVLYRMKREQWAGSEG